MSINILRGLLWMKTHMHPESLGGDRRARPRRRSDRRRDALRIAWLAALTALWLWMALTIKHDQATISRVGRDNVSQRCALTRTLLGLAQRGGPEFAAPLARDYEACARLLSKAKTTP